jgi:hypothetical protein
VSVRENINQFEHTRRSKTAAENIQKVVQHARKLYVDTLEVFVERCRQRKFSGPKRTEVTPGRPSWNGGTRGLTIQKNPWDEHGTIRGTVKRKEPAWKGLGEAELRRMVLVDVVLAAVAAESKMLLLDKRLAGDWKQNDDDQGSGERWQSR